MRTFDLLELIANGENSGIAFSRDDVRPEQLAKEIVALANFQGGRVLLGVQDNGGITGLTRTDTERWVMDTVFGRYVHPMILPFYEEVVFDGNQRVAVISIEQGVAKPYVLWNNGREDIYVRVGTTSRLASREQQARLFASGAMLHTETLGVSGTGLQDLSTERITDYLLNYVKDLGAPDSRAAPSGAYVDQTGDCCDIDVNANPAHKTNPVRAINACGSGDFNYDGRTTKYIVDFDKTDFDLRELIIITTRECQATSNTGGCKGSIRGFLVDEVTDASCGKRVSERLCSGPPDTCGLFPAWGYEAIYQPFLLCL